jgi:hypothetical protein
LTSTSPSVCSTYATDSSTSPSSRLHDLANREVERLREVEVALVVRGHGHDRARPVVGEHVVGDVDGQPLAVHGVDRVQAREDAGLLRRSGPLDRLLRRRAPHVLAHLAGVDARHELVLRREDEERRPVERVGPGREDGDVLVELLDPELDSAPSERPIQLRWRALIDSGQSTVSRSSRSAWA